MPKYVIEREIPNAGKMTEAEKHDVARRSVSVLKQLGPQIQWLHSYVTDDKVYCIYIAPDEQLILQHAKTLGIPANRISAVRDLLDASDGE
jgi:Nickel responsive protein SCO4226-like